MWGHAMSELVPCRCNASVRRIRSRLTSRPRTFPDRRTCVARPLLCSADPPIDPRAPSIKGDGLLRAASPQAKSPPRRSRQVCISRSPRLPEIVQQNCLAPVRAARPPARPPGYHHPPAHARRRVSASAPPRSRLSITPTKLQKSRVPLPRKAAPARPSLLALRELWEGPAARRRAAPSTDGGGHPLPPLSSLADPLRSPTIPRRFRLASTRGACPRGPDVMKSSA